MAQISKAMMRRLARVGLEGTSLDADMPRWNPWAVLSDEGCSMTLFDGFRALISSSPIVVDYFCPLPTSGFMLIPTVISAMNIGAVTYKKPSSTFDSPSLDHEETIKKNSRVLLVDTTINTGDALATAYRQLGRVNAQITDVAVLVFNDVAIKEYPTRIALLEKVSLHYLLTVSELLSTIE